MNVYAELTKQFNEGRLRAIICSGQAVVLHRLTIMSKDGDWILREDEDCLAHVLRVLEDRGATYRFGAPLDARWMQGGWSAHFQFEHGALRVRTDFFTRPPRITEARLHELWREQEDRAIPFLDPPDLADMKKTNRERDYAVIGELARIMDTTREKLLYSRSARDLIRLASEHPAEVERVVEQRPVLAGVGDGREQLERALDAERRELIRANEARLLAYREASAEWAAQWLKVQQQLAGLPLLEAHAMVCRRAEGVLPFEVEGAGNG